MPASGASQRDARLVRGPRAESPVKGAGRQHAGGAPREPAHPTTEAAEQTHLLRCREVPDVHEAVAFVRGWLEERAQSAVKAIQLETPSQKAERELREKQYGNLEMPGRRGPRVYRWEYHLGMWNRLRVPYEQFEAIWMATTPRMRVYNSVQHEYDICYHLDEEATAALHAEMTQVYDSNDDSEW